MNRYKCENGDEPDSMNEDGANVRVNKIESMIREQTLAWPEKLKLKARIKGNTEDGNSNSTVCVDRETSVRHV